MKIRFLVCLSIWKGACLFVYKTGGLMGHLLPWISKLVWGFLQGFDISLRFLVIFWVLAPLWNAKNVAPSPKIVLGHSGFEMVTVIFIGKIGVAAAVKQWNILICFSYLFLSFSSQTNNLHLKKAEDMNALKMNKQKVDNILKQDVKFPCTIPF